MNALRGVKVIFRSRDTVLLVLIIVLAVFMTIAFPANFPTYLNIDQVLLNAAQYGILVVGMMILMIGGQFDLSIGSTLSLCGVVAGVLYAQLGVSAPMAIAGGIVAGGIAGLFNGLIVTKLRINALIVTLATKGIFEGITQFISGTGVAPIGNSFALFGQSAFLGFGSPLWVMIIIVTFGVWAVAKMRFFRQFYFIGGNERAAKLSGIKVERMVIIGFVIMGLLAGLAGVLVAAELNAAVVDAGQGIELTIITAAVLGGASLKGGEGNVIGGFLAVIFMALIQNVLIIMNVNAFWQNIIVGLVLLFALSFDRFKGLSRK